MSETTTWAADRPTILFVFGTARSGTSALTRVLSLCGATLPVGMVGADNVNQRGYWEPRESLHLNRRILERHGSSWWDPSLLNEDALDAEEKNACLSAVKVYLSELPSAPLVVIKDLQIVPLADIWFEAARQTGFNVATVIAVRHPQEVAGSLQAAGKFSPEHASAMWLKANLLSERNTRGVPRAVVHYTNLLEDWRREVKRISAALSVDLSIRNDDTIDEFLTPNLRRQRQSGPVTDRFGTNWISTVYDAMCAAAQDQPVNTVALDGIFESYQATERDFRLAFDSNRRSSDSALNRLLRPSIAKPMMEVWAMLHRRKGTWA